MRTPQQDASPKRRRGQNGRRRWPPALLAVLLYMLGITAGEDHPCFPRARWACCSREPAEAVNGVSHFRRRGSQMVYSSSACGGFIRCLPSAWRYPLRELVQRLYRDNLLVIISTNGAWWRPVSGRQKIGMCRLTWRCALLPERSGRYRQVAILTSGNRMNLMFGADHLRIDGAINVSRVLLFLRLSGLI